jgi:N-acetylglucosaminyl-diphospho-decaprenol L-rhamnosyltransferase
MLDVTKVDVAIVIVTYNSAHVIVRLLDSIPAALCGLNADIVVVDNGSTDKTLTVLQSRNDCRVVRSHNIGYAGGINRGVQESKSAEAILALNPDVVLGPGSIQFLIQGLQMADTGVVAPQIRSADGSLYHSLRREPTLPRAIGLTRTRLPVLSECVNDDRAYDHPQIVDWALGAVLLFSRSCYDAVGEWDESYFLYSEETQFSMEARRRGYVTRYVPDAVAVHIGGQSGTNHLTHSMMVINRVRFYHRRHRAISSWCYYFLTILSELSWVVRGRRESRFAIKTLLLPSKRPPQLGSSAALLPQ